MLELDLDLEGDLGIDTVKQVEVFARVRTELGLARSANLALRDFNTLRKLIDHLAERVQRELAPSTPIAPAAPAAPPAPAGTPAPALPLPSLAGLESRLLQRSPERATVEWRLGGEPGETQAPSVSAWRALLHTGLLLGGPAVGGLSGVRLHGIVPAEAPLTAEARLEGATIAVVLRQGGRELAGMVMHLQPAPALPAPMTAAEGASSLDAPLLLEEAHGGAAWLRAASLSELVGGMHLSPAVLSDLVLMTGALIDGARALVTAAWHGLGGGPGAALAIERMTWNPAAMPPPVLATHVRVRRSGPEQALADVTLLAGATPITRLVGVRVARASRSAALAMTHLAVAS
jgi:hypothetical protein